MLHIMLFLKADEGKLVFLKLFYTWYQMKRVTVVNHQLRYKSQQISAFCTRNSLNTIEQITKIKITQYTHTLDISFDSAQNAES